MWCRNENGDYFPYGSEADETITEIGYDGEDDFESDEIADAAALDAYNEVDWPALTALRKISITNAHFMNLGLTRKLPNLKVIEFVSSTIDEDAIDNVLKHADLQAINRRDSRYPESDTADQRTEQRRLDLEIARINRQSPTDTTAEDYEDGEDDEYEEEFEDGDESEYGEEFEDGDESEYGEGFEDGEDYEERDESVDTSKSGSSIHESDTGSKGSKGSTIPWVRQFTSKGKDTHASKQGLPIHAKQTESLSRSKGNISRAASSISSDNSSRLSIGFGNRSQQSSAFGGSNASNPRADEVLSEVSDDFEFDQDENARSIQIMCFDEGGKVSYDLEEFQALNATERNSIYRVDIDGANQNVVGVIDLSRLPKLTILHISNAEVVEDIADNSDYALESPLLDNITIKNCRISAQGVKYFVDDEIESQQVYLWDVTQGDDARFTTDDKLEFCKDFNINVSFEDGDMKLEAWDEEDNVEDDVSRSTDVKVSRNGPILTKTRSKSHDSENRDEEFEPDDDNSAVSFGLRSASNDSRSSSATRSRAPTMDSASELQENTSQSTPVSSRIRIKVTPSNASNTAMDSLDFMRLNAEARAKIKTIEIVGNGGDIFRSIDLSGLTGLTSLHISDAIVVGTMNDPEYSVGFPRLTKIKIDNCRIDSAGLECFSDSRAGKQNITLSRVATVNGGTFSQRDIQGLESLFGPDRVVPFPQDDLYFDEDEENNFDEYGRDDEPNAPIFHGNGFSQSSKQAKHGSKSAGTDNVRSPRRSDFFSTADDASLTATGAERGKGGSSVGSEMDDGSTLGSQTVKPRRSEVGRLNALHTDEQDEDMSFEGGHNSISERDDLSFGSKGRRASSDSKGGPSHRTSTAPFFSPGSKSSPTAGLHHLARKKGKQASYDAALDSQAQQATSRRTTGNWQRLGRKAIQKASHDAALDLQAQQDVARRAASDFQKMRGNLGQKSSHDSALKMQAQLNTSRSRIDNIKKMGRDIRRSAMPDDVSTSQDETSVSSKSASVASRYALMNPEVGVHAEGKPHRNLKKIDGAIHEALDKHIESRRDRARYSTKKSESEAKVSLSYQTEDKGKIPVLEASSNAVKVFKSWRTEVKSNALSLDEKALLVLGTLGIPPCPDEGIKIDAKEGSMLGVAIEVQYQILKQAQDLQAEEQIDLKVSKSFTGKSS